MSSLRFSYSSGSKALQRPSFKAPIVPGLPSRSRVFRFSFAFLQGPESSRSFLVSFPRTWSSPGVSISALASNIRQDTVLQKPTHIRRTGNPSQNFALTASSTRPFASSQSLGVRSGVFGAIHRIKCQTPPHILPTGNPWPNSAFYVYLLESVI